MLFIHRRTGFIFLLVDFTDSKVRVLHWRAIHSDKSYGINPLKDSVSREWLESECEFIGWL